LEQLVHAAQQHVQQLEAAAEMASAGSVAACVAAITEDCCEEEPDDDDVDDASMAYPEAASAAAYCDGNKAAALGEIECLTSDDEQYCVQVEMAHQVAACAGVQRSELAETYHC
jgi:hypothetical protein